VRIEWLTLAAGPRSALERTVEGDGRQVMNDSLMGDVVSVLVQSPQGKRFVLANLVSYTYQWPACL